MHARTHARTTRPQCTDNHRVATAVHVITVVIIREGKLVVVVAARDCDHPGSGRRQRSRHALDEWYVQEKWKFVFLGLRVNAVRVLNATSAPDHDVDGSSRTVFIFARDLGVGRDVRATYAHRRPHTARHTSPAPVPEQEGAVMAPSSSCAEPSASEKETACWYIHTDGNQRENGMVVVHGAPTATGTRTSCWWWSRHGPPTATEGFGFVVPHGGGCRATVRRGQARAATRRSWERMACPPKIRLVRCGGPLFERIALVHVMHGTDGRRGASCRVVSCVRAKRRQLVGRMGGLGPVRLVWSPPGLGWGWRHPIARLMSTGRGTWDGSSSLLCSAVPDCPAHAAAGLSR